MFFKQLCETDMPSPGCRFDPGESVSHRRSLLLYSTLRTWLLGRFVILTFLVLVARMMDCGSITSLPTANAPNMTAIVMTAASDGYLQWLQSSMIRYPQKTYIPTITDECTGMALHWHVNVTSSKIQIAVAVQAKGWAGFGLSQTGGMKGSDIVYFTVQDSHVHDAYVADYNVQPILDDQQDWTLLNYTITSDGYLIFEAQRAFNTSDHQDWPVVNDTDPFVPKQQVIGAWGDSPVITYHGENRVQARLQLFPPSYNNSSSNNGQLYTIFVNEMNTRSQGSIVISQPLLTIPQKPTTYQETCFSTLKLISLGLPIASPSQGVYILGMEFIIPPASKKYTHHMVIYGHSSDDPTRCNVTEAPLFGWTPGNDYSYYPKGSGILVGGTSSGSTNAFTIQIHFDNRYLDSNANGTGVGVRMYYTNQTQDIQIGTIQVADPFVRLHDVRVGNGWSEHVFTCPSSCSTYLFNGAPNGEVTIVQESLHMHGHGRRMVNQILRNGQVIHEASVDYWDFAQNGLKSVQQQPYVIRVGDQIRTVCYYDSDSSTTFGLGSLNEMCLAFLSYYPAQNIAASYCAVGKSLPCSASHSSRILKSEQDIGRVFGATYSSATYSSAPSIWNSHKFFGGTVGAIFGLTILNIL